jgi:hypothetical protein
MEESKSIVNYFCSLFDCCQLFTNPVAGPSYLISSAWTAKRYTNNHPNNESEEQ